MVLNKLKKITDLDFDHSKSKSNSETVLLKVYVSNLQQRFL